MTVHTKVNDINQVAQNKVGLEYIYYLVKTTYIHVLFDA